MARFVNRSEWERPNERVTGPPPVGGETHLIWHWPGARSVPTTFETTLTWLAGMQNYALNSRGYSLYYNWSLARTGEIIEIRGDDYRNAANADDDQDDGNENAWTKSALVVVAEGGTVTDAQREAMSALATARYSHMEQQPHSWIEPTACPGPAVRAAIPAPIIGTAPQPPPPSNPEGGNVLVNLIKYKAAGHTNPQPAVWAQYSGGYKVWVPDPDTLNVLRLVSGIYETAVLDSTWFKAAGPVLPGTPVPYDCDEWGRRLF